MHTRQYYIMNIFSISRRYIIYLRFGNDFRDIRAEDSKLFRTIEAMVERMDCMTIPYQTTHTLLQHNVSDEICRLRTHMIVLTVRAVRTMFHACEVCRHSRCKRTLTQH